MKNHLIVSAMLFGLYACDARVDQDYQGEALLKVSGALLLGDSALPRDAVPALAFEGSSDLSLEILDVDAQGEFPANFSIEVRSPPPAEAMRHHPGVPSFAVGYITAVDPEHPSSVDLPDQLDGAGAQSWCEGPGSTDCYRTIEQCIEGTDECYRELARCVLEPHETMPGVKVRRCNEVLEQSGDPTIAFPWADFVGLSENYFLVYAATDAPEGAARDYLQGTAEIDEAAFIRHMTMAAAFGDRPITAGYHLIGIREFSGDELATREQCLREIDAEYVAVFNDENGTDYDSSADLLADGHEETERLVREISVGVFDAGCLPSVHHEHVDADTTAVEVKLGPKEQWLFAR